MGSFLIEYNEVRYSLLHYGLLVLLVLVVTADTYHLIFSNLYYDIATTTTTHNINFVSFVELPKPHIYGFLMKWLGKLHFF